MSDTRRGYYGIADNEGKFVEADEALEYALTQCGMSITNPDAPECEEAAAQRAWTKERGAGEEAFRAAYYKSYI